MVKCSDTSKIKLNTLSWTRSGGGKFFYDLNISNVNKLLAATIYDWGTLRDTDVVLVSTNDEKIIISSNVTSFINDESFIIIRYLYR